MRITIRLSAGEYEEAVKMAHRERTGCENISEFIRLLLARERKKSAGLAKPKGRDYATAFRNGRPRNKAQKPPDGPPPPPPPPETGGEPPEDRKAADTSRK
jgi:hypothetical protein